MVLRPSAIPETSGTLMTGVVGLLVLRDLLRVRMTDVIITVLNLIHVMNLVLRVYVGITERNNILKGIK
jgi:hypothetical protein